ncbi:MAG: cysteine--tRNA ligase [Eubacteriales bacterium]|nr:cysteine--tRNA ligase [Eubacteriales bacterium]
MYNVLKRRKDLFKPLRMGEVRMHTCGPTVHDAPHLGNYRRLVVSDLMSRYLTFKGYAVKHVVDIVDMTDKSIRGSEKAAMDLAEYSNQYLNVFLDDARFLNIRPENIYVKASENIDAMLKMVEKLVDKGYAYEKLHSVYFDISKLADYGRLSNIDLAKTRLGQSIDLDDYEKDSPADFALLKRAGLSELKRGIYHKTKWGNIRPGWHLECAAISEKYLGPAYDIHISGADETFPHGENIVAINKAYSGNTGANYWIGAELILVDGRKMSRSLNNAVTIADLKRRGYSGRDIRFFLLGMNYRKPISYSEKSLQMARNTVKKLDTFIHRLQVAENGARNVPDLDQWIYDLHHALEDALDDDLNIAEALAALFDFIGKVNAPLAEGRINQAEAGKVLKALEMINNVVGILDFGEPVVAGDVESLIARREEARKAGRWQEADLLRDQLTGLGVEVLDSRQGTLWRMK